MTIHIYTEHLTFTPLVYAPLSELLWAKWATTTTENSHIISKPFRRKY